MAVSNIPYDAHGPKVTNSGFSRQFFLDTQYRIVREEWTVAAGQVLQAGEPLGMITATRELVSCDPAAGDGSENLYAIILEDLDTSATGLNAATSVSVLTMSHARVNLNAVLAVANAGWDKYDLAAAMSRRGIAFGVPFSSAL